jgi:hypothetical protein
MIRSHVLFLGLFHRDILFTVVGLQRSRCHEHVALAHSF